MCTTDCEIVCLQEESEIVKRYVVSFTSEHPLAELSENMSTHKPRDHEEAEEYAERYRHLGRGADTIILVRAQAERLQCILRSCEQICSVLRVYFFRISFESLEGGQQHSFRKKECKQADSSP